MTTDISVFLHFKFSENVPCLKNGEIINEEAERTLSITKIKEKLKKFGFNSWQVTANRMCNKNIIAVLYAEIGINTELLIQEMEPYG